MQTASNKILDISSLREIFTYLDSKEVLNRPFPPPPDENILETKGGDGGASWDDGSFKGVRRIYIGLNQNAVAFIKFIYYKNAELVFGENHGNKTNIGVQEVSD